MTSRIIGGRCWREVAPGKLEWVGRHVPIVATPRFRRGQRVVLHRAVTIHGQRVEPGSVVTVLVPDVDHCGLVTVDCHDALSSPISSRTLQTHVPATVDVADVEPLAEADGC